jgi:hypothetical protein
MMKSQVMTMDKALGEVFLLSNEELSEKTGMNYNTIASWRFNYRTNRMSHEKKIEILTRMNYEFNEPSKWKKSVK